MTWKAWGIPLAVAACLVSLVPPALAQKRNVRFEHLSIEQGLSQSLVNCIFQDRRGYIWVGTEEGLNRYDGQTFTVYKHDPQNPQSLAHNFVWAIHEDGKGRLWVGTYGGGLDLWDPRSDGFRHFRNDPKRPESLSDDRVRTIFEDRAGTLWIGTHGGGLVRFDPETNSFTRVAGSRIDSVRTLFDDGAGGLWIGTFSDGLSRLDRKTGEIRQYKHDDRDPGSLPSDDPVAILEDREGVFWVGTLSGGLSALDRATGRFTRYRHDPANPSSLCSDHVRFIHQDDAGTLWVGTEGGLNEWKPKRKNFAVYHSDPNDPRTLNSDRLTTMFQDRGGVVWIGTMAAGLNKWNPTTDAFMHLKEDPGAATSLASDYVFALDEDAAGVLWIGMRGGGLDAFDRKAGRVTHYRHDPKRKTSLSDDRVMSVLADRKNRVWVGTIAGGLNRLDAKPGTFERFMNNPADPGSIAVNGIMSLYEDSKGVLWVGLFEGGLDRFDEKTGTFEHHRHDPSNPRSISNNRVTSILEDASGALWVATDGGGLNRFDRSTGAFTAYRHDPSNREGLSSDHVYAIHEDARGTLWVGTAGAGLARWEREPRLRGEPRFKSYSERDGLSNDTVYGLVSDDQGALWLSTNRGLARFDPVKEHFKTYTADHGLQSNEFNFGAYAKTAAGEILFGGVKGITLFHPERVRDNDHVPPVVLTAFLKNNHPVRLEDALASTGTFDFSYHDSLVSFDVAALDFAAPEKNRYAYMLEGFDKEWIDLGNLHRITFTNLPAGDFVLRVKASNNDGVWNEEGLRLRLSVAPPPWKSWWAYLAYALAIAGAILLYTRAQKEKLAREAEYSRTLEHKVQERTQALEEKTVELEEKSVALARSNEELQLANQKLAEASTTDSLTGARNRHYLTTVLSAEFEQAAEFYMRLAEAGIEPPAPIPPVHANERRKLAAPNFLFLMVDLDGFKPLNDTHGHDAGDRALVKTAELLRNACRRTDTIIRWGGDEFLIVARHTDRQHAETMAERIRSAVAAYPFEAEGGTARLGCSIGFAFYPFVPEKPLLLSPEQVIAIADRALYVSKTSGRNAWVGIHSNGNTPTGEVLSLITDDLDRAVSAARIDLRSSIDDHARLVWERA